MIDLPLEYTYCQLPESLYVPYTPYTFPDPKLAIINQRLLLDLGIPIDGQDHRALLQLLLGQTLSQSARPIAMAYAGHQFGSFTKLGDGRAFLLGEWLTPQHKRVDIHLKGAGKTVFARNGDGKAVLGPMLREYIISEAMNALGIPTTRSLAVITTGEPVFRQGIQPGAVLVRTASSHIRIGTFQYAATKSDAIVEALLTYTVKRHYPDLYDQQQPLALAFLNQMIEQLVTLVVNWERVGFIHGVMNTDNIAISGETFDYGPCAFMDSYSPHCVFSSIDTSGRYAFKNQGPIAQWNLARLAEVILPFIDPEPETAIELATESLDQFPSLYQSAWLEMMRQKLGLITPRAEDIQLIDALLSLMYQHRLDYTEIFFRLTYETESMLSEANHPLQNWFQQWQERIKIESTESVYQQMKASNPVIIPRNHRVDYALTLAERDKDLTAVEELLSVITKPYDLSDKARQLNIPPKPEERIEATFCGT